MESPLRNRAVRADIFGCPLSLKKKATNTKTLATPMFEHFIS